MTTQTLQYNVTIIIPENNDLEAIATTYEQYLKDFINATKTEYPQVQVLPLIITNGHPNLLDL